MSVNAEFSREMFAFIEKAKGRVHELTRGVLHEIAYRIAMRSPVGDPSRWHPPYWPKGYSPGHYLNNWQLGIDQVPAGEIPGTVDNPYGVIRRLQKVGRWPAGHTYHFVNNVPYARRIERGWSDQAPYGVIALTKMEYGAIVRKVQGQLGNSSGGK